MFFLPLKWQCAWRNLNQFVIINCWQKAEAMPREIQQQDDKTLPEQRSKKPSMLEKSRLRSSRKLMLLLEWHSKIIYMSIMIFLVASDVRQFHCCWNYRCKKQNGEEEEGKEADIHSIYMFTAQGFFLKHCHHHKGRSLITESCSWQYQNMHIHLNII